MYGVLEPGIFSNKYRVFCSAQGRELLCVSLWVCGWEGGRGLIGQTAGQGLRRAARSLAQLTRSLARSLVHGARCQYTFNSLNPLQATGSTLPPSPSKHGITSAFSPPNDRRAATSAGEGLAVKHLAKYCMRLIAVM